MLELCCSARSASVTEGPVDSSACTWPASCELGVHMECLAAHHIRSCSDYCTGTVCSHGRTTDLRKAICAGVKWLPSVLAASSDALLTTATYHVRSSCR